MYVKEPYHNIQVKIGDASFFIHDMNAPWMQVKNMLMQLATRLEGVEHVLFYGVGVRYLVKLFAEKYPAIKITIYEPIESIFQLFNEMKVH